MSCVDTCGTGLTGIQNPKPGDPDNSMALSANQVYGGINLTWTFPTINPYAVAYTQIYRGINNTFGNSVEIAKVGGSIYFDALNPNVETTYYYWIRWVSINGTTGTVVGPVSAIAKPRGIQTLESLSGMIDDSVLANALKTDIAKIALVNSAILDEALARAALASDISDQLATVQANIGDQATLILNETTQRQDGDAAAVNSINLLATHVDQNYSFFLDEKAFRTTKDESYASQFITLGATVAGNTAAITSEQTARTTADTALATSITALTATVNTNTAAIVTEQTTRASQDSALSSSISTLTASVNSNAAAITTEQSARADADSAAATSLAALTTRVTNAEAGISTEAATRASADSANSSLITTVSASVATNTSNIATNTAAIASETTARVNADNALSASITTAQSTLNGNISSVQTTLQTNINTVDSKVTSIGALYTAKVTVNGLVGGFGIYNNGYSIDAGFDVDTFWVGKVAGQLVKPFIISGGVTYIDIARIRDADVSTLKIAGNAVTIPVTVTSSATTYGNGGYQTVINGSIYLDQAATVYAATSGQIAFGSGWVDAGSRMKINGTTVSDGGGTQAYQYAAHSGSLYCAAGLVTVTLEFYGLDSRARIINPSMFIQAAKR